MLPFCRLFVITTLILSPASEVEAKLCNRNNENCRDFVGSGSSGASASTPSGTGRVTINPSAVPTEKFLGLGGIYYKGSLDFLLVKGLGRVGAAISPSNSEETFFGPPGLEPPETYAARKEERNKFKSQKLTGATSFNVVSNEKSGLKRFELNLGVMGRYNTISRRLRPGAGLSGIAGPFTFGASFYEDETILSTTDSKGSTRSIRQEQRNQTFSAGLFLNSIVLDYSVLQPHGGDDSVTDLITGTALVRRGVFTIARRRERSNRPEYDQSLDILVDRPIKYNWFFGAQLFVGDHLLVGIFHNYYLLKEVSIGATVLF